MSPPRRQFGPNPPGRLAGTMVRVLAAELADPARFSRGKVYARDGAVVDIDVEPGVVRAEVHGSRYEPYGVELHVRPASRDELAAFVAGTAAGSELLVPDRSELVATCTCPDDARACKHAVAAVLVLADEVTIDPRVLARWRSAAGALAPASIGATRAGPDPVAPLLARRGAWPVEVTVPPLDPVPMSVGDRELGAVIDRAVAVARAAGRRRGRPAR